MNNMSYGDDIELYSVMLCELNMFIYVYRIYTSGYEITHRVETV